MARVLLRTVRDGRLPWMDAYYELVEELEEIPVGPDRRRLTQAEREALAKRLLGEGGSR